MSNETKTVSIGETIKAIETIVNASKVMGPHTLSRIITNKLYASHDSKYIEMLAVSGEVARQIQQDAWHVENADKIVNTRSFSVLDSSFELIELTEHKI
jgi:hypothetical protein